MIFAKKGNIVTKFTDMIWKNMGVNKNGWSQISESQYTDFLEGKPVVETASSTAAKADVDVEKEYKKLTAQAKGFFTDEKYEEALEKYREALVLKTNPYIRGQINKIEALIKEKEGSEDLIESGDQAVADQDYVLAFELYSAAKEFDDSEELAEKLKTVEEKIAQE